MGNYEAKLDDSNRFILPAPLRKCMDPEAFADGLVVVPREQGKRLWLYPAALYDRILQIATSARRRLAPEQTTQQVKRLFYGLITKIEVDKQGRVTLPDRDVREAALGRDIVLVGVDDHIELWNREDWQKERVNLLYAQNAIEEQARVLMDIESATVAGPGSSDGARPADRNGPAHTPA